jgi:hypothetical protein
MDENAEPDGGDSYSGTKTQEEGRTFFFSTASGLYLPQTIHPAHEVNVKLNAKLENPGVHKRRPLGSFQDSLSTFISSVALLVSLATLIGLGFTVKFAYEQANQMRLATDASASSALTSAQALRTNQEEFLQDLVELRKQTNAQQQAAIASRNSADASAEMAKSTGIQLAMANGASQVGLQRIQLFRGHYKEMTEETIAVDVIAVMYGKPAQIITGLGVSLRKPSRSTLWDSLPIIPDTSIDTDTRDARSWLPVDEYRRRRQDSVLYIWGEIRSTGAGPYVQPVRFCKVVPLKNVTSKLVTPENTFPPHENPAKYRYDYPEDSGFKDCLPTLQTP